VSLLIRAPASSCVARSTSETISHECCTTTQTSLPKLAQEFIRRQLHSGRAAKDHWVDSRGYQHFENRGRGSFFTGRRPWYILGGAGLTFSVYYYSCLERVPYTGRSHSIMFVSRQQEKSLGKIIFEMQRQEAAMQRALLPDNHPMVQLVKKIGARVAAVASDGGGGGNSEHMKDLQWEYAIIASPIPNAFVVPGGKVVVFTGLIDLLRSEEELAAVLAHETAHVLARHHAERMSTMNLWSLAKFLSYVLLGFGLPDAALYLGIFLPYSRRAEHEADVIGLRLMARACYDPGACTTMLAKLNAKEQEAERQSRFSTPAFLRTHPLTESRVDLVRKELPVAYKLYEESGCGLVQGMLQQFMQLLDPPPLEPGW